MTTFYKKEVSKNGKVTYKPVYQYCNELSDAFPEGSHLVVCKPGSRSRVYNIDPAIGEFLAASLIMQDFMVNELVKNTEAKPDKEPLTEKQAKAWELFKKDFGGTGYLRHESAHTIVKNTLQSVIDHMEKDFKSDAVKKAWDNFIMLAKLAGEK